MLEPCKYHPHCGTVIKYIDIILELPMPLFDSGDTDIFVLTFREVGLVLWLSLRMCWAHVGSGLSHFGGPNLSVPWQGDVIGVVCRNSFIRR